MVVSKYSDCPVQASLLPVPSNSGKLAGGSNGRRIIIQQAGPALQHHIYLVHIFCNFTTITMVQPWIKPSLVFSLLNEGSQGSVVAVQLQCIVY